MRDDPRCRRLPLRVGRGERAARVQTTGVVAGHGVRIGRDAFLRVREPCGQTAQIRVDGFHVVVFHHAVVVLRAFGFGHGLRDRLHDGQFRIAGHEIRWQRVTVLAVHEHVRHAIHAHMHLHRSGQRQRAEGDGFTLVMLVPCGRGHDVRVHARQQVKLRRVIVGLVRGDCRGQLQRLGFGYGSARLLGALVEFRQPRGRGADPMASRVLRLTAGGAL
nr:MAG: hypothetical protein [Bacteriophage sp.]